MNTNFEASSSHQESSEKVENNEVNESLKTQWEVVKDIIREWSWEKIISTIDMDPKTQWIVNKVMDSCINKIETSFNSIWSIQSFQQKIYEKNPELWNFLTIELWINNISCDNFHDCTPDEKMLLLTIEKTLAEDTFFTRYKREEDWSFNIEIFKKKFSNASRSVNEEISDTFNETQSYFSDPKESFKISFWLTDDEADSFIKYLEEVKTNIDATKPQEAGIGTVIAVVATAVVTSLLRMKYIDIKYWDWEKKIKTWLISLWDPETLASIITAKQGFEMVWDLDHSLYEENSDDWWFKRNGKKVVNARQSKELQMTLYGELWVTFDLHWAKFNYNYDSKMIEIELPEPEAIMLYSDPIVNYKNWEVFEMEVFKNDEIELYKELENKALSDAKTRELLISKAHEWAMDIFLKVYWPVLENSWEELKWITVTMWWIRKDKLQN